jgi:DNA-binding transcriptional ArsR family regulator
MLYHDFSLEEYCLVAVLTVLLQMPDIRDADEPVLRLLVESPLVETIWISSRSSGRQLAFPKCRTAPREVLNSGDALNSLLSRIDTPWLLVIPDALGLDIPPSSLERLLEVGGLTGAGLVYADFRERRKDGHMVDHPLLDYQLGSIRDTFDFGPLMLFSVPAISQALNSRGAIPSLNTAGLYDLRLKLSLNSAFFHLPEFLCTRAEIDDRQQR